MALLTLAEAKAYLGVSGSGDDSIITDMIGEAAGAMEDECGRHLDTATVTETVDGTGDYDLWLSEPPDGGKSGITTIHEDADQSWTDTTLVSADDYLVTRCRVERLDSIWLNAQRAVRVVYAAGYASPPARLKRLYKIQVAVLYSEWQRAKQGKNIVASMKQEGWSETYIQQNGLDPDVVAGLEAFRPARL